MAKKSEGWCKCGSGMFAGEDGACMACREYAAEEYAVPVKALVPGPKMGEVSEAAATRKDAGTTPLSVGRQPTSGLPFLIRSWEGTDFELAVATGVSWSSVMRAKRGDRMSDHVTRKLMEVLK